MMRYHDLMKRIQIAVPDAVYIQAKRALTQHDLTWQKWGQAQVERLTEDLDTFGIPLTEMAVDKSQFMTKIQEKLVGALRESAFILLAKKNDQSKWVEHKENEVERLKLELLDVFDLESKGKWNKLKAAKQAIEFYRPRLKTFITKANTQFPRYYKTQPTKGIAAEDLEPILNEILQSLPTD